MDPLSVAASITGLLTASVEVAKLFAAVVSANDYAQTVHDEIHHFRFILFRLYEYIHSDSLNVARASMIDLDQVVSVIMGCIYTFSELEREIDRLQSRPERLRRLWWTMAKPSLADLVQRIQNHKATICSMILILNSESQDEAVSGIYKLQRDVAELVRINAEMAHKLESITAGSALPSGASIAGPALPSGASIAGSVTTTQSVFLFTSTRTNFETTLKNSRIYRRALLERIDKPRERIHQGSTLSIQQSWSVLSGLSLSEVSNYSAYSLPICPQELYNPTWYTTSNQALTLGPGMPSEVPNLLTLTFAETLKIALKQGDTNLAKTIANYIPYNLIRKMSEVFPVIASQPPNSSKKVLDSLSLFKLWLQCGGAIEDDSWSENAIREALWIEDWELFKLLIQNGSDIDTLTDSGTALHLVSAGRADNFVLRVCEDKEAEDGVELASIDCGMERKRALAIGLLFKLGANINAEDRLFKTPLYHASTAGHLEVVEVLLSHGAYVDAKGVDGKTALHSASAGGYEGVVEVLLAHGAYVDANGVDGKTALHSASAGGYEGVVEVLLAHGADVNATRIDRMTALHHGSAGGHKGVVEVLLAHGAYVDATRVDGKTALHSASAGGYEGVVVVLLAHGARVNAMAFDWMTALYRGSAGGHTAVVKVLLDHGANVNARRSDGMTALHGASLEGHKDVVEILLAQGADVNARDKLKATALHNASRGGHTEVLEILLSQGADVNARGDYSMTALHIASACGDEVMVEILLRHGADIEAKDISQETALELALRRGHETVAKTLAASICHLGLSNTSFIIISVLAFHRIGADMCFYTPLNMTFIWLSELPIE